MSVVATTTTLHDLPDHVETFNAKDDVSCITTNTLQTLDTTVVKRLGLSEIFRPKVKADEALHDSGDHVGGSDDHEDDRDDDEEEDESLIQGLTRNSGAEVFDDDLAVVEKNGPSLFRTKGLPMVKQVDSYLNSQDSTSLPISACDDKATPSPEKFSRQKRLFSNKLPTMFSFETQEDARQKHDEDSNMFSVSLDRFATDDSSGNLKSTDHEEGNESRKIIRLPNGFFILISGVLVFLVIFLAVFFARRNTSGSVATDERVEPMWVTPSRSPFTQPVRTSPSKRPTIIPTVPIVVKTTLPSMGSPISLTRFPTTTFPSKRPNSRNPTIFSQTSTPSRVTATPSSSQFTSQPTIPMDFYDLIVMQSPESVTPLSDPNSPQSVAFALLEIKRDVEAFGLLTLFLMTNKTGWTNTWDLTLLDKCAWYGVDCSPDGHVSGLFLSFNGLNGRLPDEISLLTHLRGLSLAGSAEIRKVQGNLEGTIPASWGRTLTNLRALELYDNKLTGSIPTSFSKMTLLETLNLSGNKLSGSLRGQIDNLGSLSNLDLSSNNFVGDLPAELGNLSNLKYLSLADNALFGSIPTYFNHLIDLEELYLSNNNLDGDIGAVSSMRKLEWIALHDNQFTGGLASFLLLTKLIGIQLHNNRMEEVLPPNWGNLKMLRFLDLASNDFFGTIAESVVSLHQLVHLSLDHNHLSGQVPSGICDLPGLLRLSADCGSDVQCNCCTECHV